MDKNVLFWTICLGYCGAIIAKWLIFCHLKKHVACFGQLLIIISALNFLFSTYYQSWQALIYMGVVVILLAILVIDFQLMIIPDSLNFSILVIALFQVLIKPEIWKNRLISFLILVSFLFLILALEKILKREVIGGGDLKLLIALGAFSGILSVLLMLFISSMLGIVGELIRQNGREKKEAFAFGPYLVVGWITLNILKIIFI